MLPPLLTDAIRVCASMAVSADDPVIALLAVTRLRADLEAVEREQVRRALERGTTFSTIGATMGVSRQAAHRRFRGLRGQASEHYGLELSAGALRVLRRAGTEAARAEAARVGAVHVVLALIALGHAAAGVDIDQARACAGVGAGCGPFPSELEPALAVALEHEGAPVGLGGLLRAVGHDPAARALIARIGRMRRDGLPSAAARG
jgi:hypothetical protein